MQIATASSRTHHLNAKRAATPAIALSAFLAAWVLAASEPAVGEESVYDLASLGNGPVLIAQIDVAQSEIQPIKAQHEHARGTPLFGEISSIEPIKQSPQQSKSIVGYRVHVRLDNGGNRSYDRKSLDGLDVGARVRIQNGSLRGV